MAGQLHALLGAASLPPKYVLVGHSFGGFVVLAFASQFREQVAGLVLVVSDLPVRMARDELGAALPASRRRVSFARGRCPRAGGAVRACLSLLAGGSTGLPRTVAKLFGAEASATLDRLVGEVQKLPPEISPAVRAHWSQPKSFVSMAGHLGSLTKSAAELSTRLRPLGDLPMIVISAESQPLACKAEHKHLRRSQRAGSTSSRPKPDTGFTSTTRHSWSRRSGMSCRL